MKLFYQNLNDNFIARHAMGFVKVLSMLAIGIQKKKKLGYGPKFFLTLCHWSFNIIQTLWTMWITYPI